ncbi:VWA domain-containing protein [Pseudoxanthomonas putridarboris]|uniref:VWA domain-containing protein n=1 Tax=Pseudoxanthomonas putridarboris TaxID=752605 RepID=A0ABU9J581_9GAMM
MAAEARVSGWLDTLHFLRPHWLWALLALPLLVVFWRIRRRRASAWRGRVDAHLLPHLLAPGATAARGGLIVAILAYVLAVLALAGPSWRMGEQPLWQSRASLVVVLDLSSRITASDIPPSRLLQVRAKLARLLDARSGGQVALVVYADDAFTVTPLTEDAANIRLYLDDLSPDIMPVDGQRPARGIAWATRLLKQADARQGEILLISDRADSEARDAAAAAKSQGYTVSALGVGSAAGAAYRGSDGTIGRAALDSGSLQRLASAGGGRYQALTAGDADLSSLGVLLPEQAAQAEAGMGSGKAWRDEGYWLLLPLMLLSLLAFRRGGILLVAGCLLLPMASPAHAAGQDWWQRADQQQHARLEQGAQAYRGGDFAAAEQAFAGIDTAEGWYNLGNALAKQGRYDDAIRAYDSALQRQPGMEDAVANRAAVDAVRKRPPSDGGQGQGNESKGQGDQGRQGESQNKSQDKPDDRSHPPQDPSSQDASGKNEEDATAQRPPPSSPSGTSPAPQSPPDAAAQAAADAAQRERMQQAIAQQAGEGKADQPGQQAVAAETPEQRERRQAVDAWLRRVPDEPGSLLKAKFRLEHERRQREGQ